MFEAVEGKLREVKVFTRPTSDGRSTVSFRTFIVEMPYHSPSDLDVGKLMAAKTMSGDYLILEVVDYLPVHYAMLGMDGSVPIELRSELMRRIEESWAKGESREAWIDVYAYPVGYLLRVSRDGSVSFSKGYSPPLMGSAVYVLDSGLFERFACSSSGQSIGKIMGYNVNMKVDLFSMAKYHTGIFAFTGSGKSNLISTLVRRIVNLKEEVKVVVIDVSLEYAVLLLDVLLTQDSRLAMTERLPPSKQDAAKKMFRSHVIPEDLSDLSDSIYKGFSKLVEGKAKHLYVPASSGQLIMTYAHLLDMIRSQIEDKYTATAQKPLFFAMLQKLDEFMRRNNLSGEDPLGEEVNGVLDEVESQAREARLRENMSIFSFLSSIRSYLGNSPAETSEYDLEKLALEIADPKGPKVFVVETPSVEIGRTVAGTLIERIFDIRKRAYSVKPSILFILDEAQEFIPYDTKQRDNSEFSSQAVEKLLRHGRKYHMHGLISTQRLAYLNTNVLQQIHTYFISTLPRPYDRQLVAETFSISDSLLDRTLDLETGQWLLISFKAATPNEVPVFFNAENNLTELRSSLREILQVRSDPH